MSMRKKLEHLENLGRNAELGGGEARLDAQQAKGKLLARQRLALLLDEDSFVEMDRFVTYVSRGVAALVYVLAPEMVVFGTIAVAAGEELFFQPLRERVDALVWSTLREKLRLVPAELGDDLPYRAGICAALEGMRAGGGER